MAQIRSLDTVTFSLYWVDVTLSGNRSVHAFRTLEEAQDKAKKFTLAVKGDQMGIRSTRCLEDFTFEEVDDYFNDTEDFPDVDAVCNFC